MTPFSFSLNSGKTEWHLQPSWLCTIQTAPAGASQLQKLSLIKGVYVAVYAELSRSCHLSFTVCVLSWFSFLQCYVSPLCFSSPAWFFPPHLSCICLMSPALLPEFSPLVCSPTTPALHLPHYLPFLPLSVPPAEQLFPCLQSFLASLHQRLIPLLIWFVFNIFSIFYVYAGRWLVTENYLKCQTLY